MASQQLSANDVTTFQALDPLGLLLFEAATSASPPMVIGGLQDPFLLGLALSDHEFSFNCVHLQAKRLEACNKNIKSGMEGAKISVIQKTIDLQRFVSGICNKFFCRSIPTFLTSFALQQSVSDKKSRVSFSPNAGIFAIKVISIPTS